jgi:N-acyl-D-aspartate/D-glutamate deacylase
MYDLILRGGRIYDGSGMPSFCADVGVSGGRIAAIGRISERGEKEIDAGGLAVAPGIIDFHTHFDAQIWWDPLGSSSNEHGVTTVVMGNCGLTLAPCKVESRAALIGTFVRVEGMPRESLQAGIPWGWSSHGEFLDALGSRPLGLNIATLVGHCAVRQYAMGEASVERRATDAEISQMEELVRQGIAAGAFGFSTNSNQSHFREDGRPVPSRFADIDEIQRLCRVVASSRRGAVQFTHGAFATPEHVAHISKWYDTILGETGRPLIGESIRHRWSEPDLWRRQLDDVAERWGRGFQSYAMTSTRRSVRRWSVKDGTRFNELTAWKRVAGLSGAARAEELRAPAFRKMLIGEIAAAAPATNVATRWHSVVVSKVSRPEHSDAEGKSIEELSRLQNKAPVDVLFDLALADNLETIFEESISQGDERAVAAIFQSPYVMLGQSDAGAHVASGNPGFGFGTLMLGHWVRERKLMTLEDAVRKLTFMPASIFGLHDRGLLRPGMAADIFVFEPSTIALDRPRQVNDLPGGAPRYVQSARGIHCSIVNGSLLMEKGTHTGAYPGRVLRSRAF